MERRQQQRVFCLFRSRNFVFFCVQIPGRSLKSVLVIEDEEEQSVNVNRGDKEEEDDASCYDAYPLPRIEMGVYWG